MKIKFIINLIIALIFCSGTVFAATIHVPGDQPTIQAGIDVAVNGDIVLVADGTYTGAQNKDLNFMGKAITVKSENGPANCIIDCQGNALGFHFYYGEGQDSVVSGFTIKNSISGYGVGAINCNNSSPTITDCSITGNGDHGISCLNYSSPTIEDCTITGNNGSGILCLNYSSPSISNCTIADNTDGVGISCGDSSSPTITNCSITNNDSGGIFSENSSPIIETCSIIGNSGWGIFYNDNSFGSISNCIITGNSDVGIICSENSSPIIANCSITGNSGLGIDCNRDSSPPIKNCIIANNADSGIMCYLNSSPTIEDSTITGNTAVYGGGIHIYNSSPTIVNCVLSGNTTGSTGTVHCAENSSPFITNCTITGNTGGGIRSYSSSPTVTNSIFWGDSTDEIGGSGLVVTYSDIQGGYPGEGNINADPLFVGNGDYHLSLGSPCIDAGTNDAPELPDTDIEGNPRIIDGDNDGTATVDMGADEYYVGQPVPDVKANGSDGPLTITQFDNLIVEVALDPGIYTGYPADWWVLADAPFGWYYYNLVNWQPGQSVTYQAGLSHLAPYEVLNTSGLSTGNYIFYFGVDGKKDGKITYSSLYYDKVEVTVEP